MTDKIFFEAMMVFIVFMIFVFFNIIKKIFFKSIKIDDIRQSLEYTKHQKIISTNLKKLSRCSKHLDLSIILVELHQSLDYFEKYKINILDRPPSKLRRTVDIYSSALIEKIYIAKNENNLTDVEEDLSFLEEGESEEEKEERKRRRAKYKEEVKAQENLDILHGTKRIEDYLDIKAMREIQKLSVQSKLSF
jgi:hypothetical protein